MHRLLLNSLIDWKTKPTRQPALISGARQVGKSYLVEQLFGKSEFNQVIKLDFLNDPGLVEIFNASLNPADIISSIELRLNRDINLATDLIFFDEIGECQQAVTSLKYFAENMPHIYLCASGSNIGLLGSFPVGKVEWFNLYPMNFEEFLGASNQPKLLSRYQTFDKSKVVHGLLWKTLLDYYYVGGMPAAVKVWFNVEGGSALIRSRKVSVIHEGLLNGYANDFRKYSGAVNALHIEAVFNNVPRQLANYVDKSVSRFRFKEPIKNKSRYIELLGPISWLEKSKLISRCSPIDANPVAPLAAQCKDNILKLFLFDIGLLSHMLNLNYGTMVGQAFTYKGYIGENFVQNEFVAMGYLPTYSWSTRSNEVEFLITDATGNVVPVEVKSGQNAQAKSLKAYREKYQPVKTVKLIGAECNFQSQANLVMPIYYASKIDQVL